MTRSRFTFNLTDLAPLPAGPARAVAYLGTPDVAVAPLRALVGAGVNVVVVVTGRDKRRGRGGATAPSPVKSAALELGLRVEHDVDSLVDAGADLGVVVAYGRIVPASILRVVPMLNVHFSLLPRWRGAAPVERALLAGDDVTGVCIMRVVEGLDEGEVYDTVRVPVRSDHTLSSLRAELVEASLEPLLRVVCHGVGEPRPQSGDVVYARKIGTDDLRIDWNRAVSDVWALTRLEAAWFLCADRRIRVVRARPGADSPATGLRPGEVIDVNRDGVLVACGTGTLVIERVRPEGRHDMDAAEWARGARLVDASRGTATRLQ